MTTVAEARDAARAGADLPRQRRPIVEVQITRDWARTSSAFEPKAEPP